MKILCVILPDFVLENQFTNTPEGTFRIHGILKLAGYESRLMDLRMCNNDYELQSAIMAFINDNFDICLISATTAQGNIVNSFADSFKQKFPDKMLVLGGTHVNAITHSRHWSSDDLFKMHPNVNCFACGYYWNKHDIDKLISQIGDNAMVCNKGYQTKDAIVPLPYEDLQNNSVSHTGGVMRNGSVGEIPTQNMLISVGCAFDCAFCFNEFSKCSRPNAVDVVAEISRRVTRYGIKGLKINDDDAFHNVKWNLQFAECLERQDYRMAYLASTRCDLKHGGKKLESIIALNKLGLSVLGLGVEWADDRVLVINNKRIVVDDAKRSIELLQEYTDVEILLYSIFGLPGMDDEAVDKMIEFLQWCRGRVKHVSMTNFVPLIGTDIYEYPEKYDMNLMVPTRYEDGIDWSKFYFSGKFDEIRGLPSGMTPEGFLALKLKVYRCLNECGFLRNETKRDAEKAGFLI